MAGTAWGVHTLAVPSAPLAAWLGPAARAGATVLSMGRPEAPFQPYYLTTF